MPSPGQTLDRPLAWRTSRIGEGYVRTAVGADGSVLVETFLADRSHGTSIAPGFRMVVIPAAIARAVVAGMARDLAGGRRGGGVNGE